MSDLQHVIIDDRDIEFFIALWRKIKPWLVKVLPFLILFLAAGRSGAQGGWEDNTTWQKICNNGSMAGGFSGPSGLTDTAEDINSEAGGCSWAIYPDIYTNPGAFQEFYEFYSPWFDFSSSVDRMEFIGSFRMDTPEAGFFGEHPANKDRYCTDVGLEYTVDGVDQTQWVIQYVGGQGQPISPPPLLANQWHTPTNGYGLDEEIALSGSNRATRARFVFRFNQSICYHTGVYATAQNIYRFLIDNLGIRGYSNVPTATATPTTTGTATSTPTATPTGPTGTPTTTATNRPEFNTPTITPECFDACPTSTPTLVKRFPDSYDFVPTAIPTLAFPSWPAAPTIPPIPRPLPVSLALISTPPPAPLTPSLVITYSTPMIIDLDQLPTPEPLPSGQPTPTPWPLADDITDYTDWLSDTVSDLQGGGVITLATAPEDYAPTLPQDMADLGYTFEQLSNGGNQKFSLTSWAALFGYTVALPIRMGKNLWDLFADMGPVGLFFAWLFIIIPVALFFKAIRFIVIIVRWLLDFILAVFDFLWKLWEAIPFIG